MNFDIENKAYSAIREQLKIETQLEEKYNLLQFQYTGLKDLDVIFDLINCKFSITLASMQFVENSSDQSSRESVMRLAGEKARDAVARLEELINVDVSEDQKTEISGSRGYVAARENFNTIIVKGGSFFFEKQDDDDWIDKKMISRAVAGAIHKYVLPDDNYAPLFKTEELPEPLRRIANVFFSNLAPEGQSDPPYGIEDPEEQEIYSSDTIKLPLSQAIHYYEHERIPELESELKANPGDSEIQKQIELLWERVTEYKKLVFFPRSIPIVAPQGFYTEGLTQYTEEGELLVVVDLPVKWKSGTNLDRQQDLVKDDITRRLAGKGICPELDDELARLSRMDSGPKGSALFPRSKLNTRIGFRNLKRKYPTLSLLDNKKDFQRLIEEAKDGNSSTLRKLIEDKLFQIPKSEKRTPGLLDSNEVEDPKSRE
jgi:hypothetical protein